MMALGSVMAVLCRFDDDARNDREYRNRAELWLSILLFVLVEEPPDQVNNQSHFKARSYCNLVLSAAQCCSYHSS
jgi:hypothetical protein